MESNYLTVASILAAFAIQVLMFRVGREAEIEPPTKRWLAWADALVLLAIVLLLGLVVLPAVAFSKLDKKWSALGAASSATGTVLLTAYSFAILHHYGLLSRKEKRARWEPKP